MKKHGILLNVPLIVLDHFIKNLNFFPSTNPNQIPPPIQLLFLPLHSQSRYKRREVM
jgi:hypothetical protein